MIQSSGLSDWVKSKSVETFGRLAEAEGKIHNRPAEEVQFHEVGAVDSIVDIIGTIAALEELRPVQVISARINVGQGTLRCQHGVYPAPGPATLELLRGLPIYSTGETGELTTPTGAALLAAIADSFGPRPAMTVDRIGYGAGTKDFHSAANVLRISMGQFLPPEPVRENGAGEEVAVIEANVDDMSPQLYGHFQEKALAAGALDVFSTPVQMKKNRPGMLLTVVCENGKLDALAQLVFAETTTIGLRHTPARRKILDREFVRVGTAYGEVTVKVCSASGRRLNYAPEYESCRSLAEKTGAPLKEIMAAAVSAYLDLDRK
jgi:pyridinium-3,5-bisthiocarboxylic acid mononucleotide nickel chelatase